MSSAGGFKGTPLAEATDYINSGRFFWNMDTPPERKLITFYRWALVQHFYFRGGWMWSFI